MKTVKNSQLKLDINETTLTLKVTDLASNHVWQMTDEGPGDLGIKGHCGPYQGFMFKDAMKRLWTQPNEQTLECTLTGWPYTANVWSPLGFGVKVRFILRQTALKIEISPVNQTNFEASLIDSFYPRGFLFDKQDKGDLVLPISQGTLLDKDETYDLDCTLPVYVGPGFTMPWWGQLTDRGEGFIALTTTPDDLCFRITNKSHRGMTCHPYWQASLGGLKYTRNMTFKFFTKTSVMELAKAYRQHASSQGQDVTLRMKALEKPMIDTMIGGAFWNIWMMSNFDCNPNGRNQLVFIRFAEAQRRYQELLKRTGLDRVILHIDGWGQDGYDYNHPDVLPPDERMGGWEGLTNLVNAAHQNGHGLILHDNYVDFYKHTQAYQTTNGGSMSLDGMKHESSEWLGGSQEWLCSSQANYYLKRNLDEIQKHCNIDGEYVDCWTIGHLRECFDQRHLATRTNTRNNWGRGFNDFANRGMIVGSESGNDWAIPYLDFCHTVQPDVIPFCLSGKVTSFGKSIPLYGLVWHDCVVVPSWISQSPEPAVIKDGMVIPQTKDPRLWGLLWGGIPAYRTSVQDNHCQVTDQELDQDADFILSLKIISDFNRQVGYEPITNWEMLDQDGMHQKTTFGNGATAEVNFRTGDYQLTCAGKEWNGQFTPLETP